MTTASNRPLDLQAQVALARSDRVLVGALRALARDRPDERVDLCEAAYQTVLATDPSQLRHRDVQAAFDVALGGARRPSASRDGLFNLTPLRDVANAFLFFDGDRLTVRPERLLDYASLIADVEPALLIGSLLAERLEAGEVTVDSLDALLDVQCPLGLPRQETGRMHADNHVHFGGVTSVGHALMAFATGRPGPMEDWPLPKAFRTVFDLHLKRPLPSLASAYGMLFGSIARWTMAGADPEAENPWRALSAGLRPLMERGFAGDGPAPLSLLGVAEMAGVWSGHTTRSLLTMAAQRAQTGDWSGAFLLIATLVCRLDRLTPSSSSSRRPRLALTGFVHLTHALRDTMIMHGQGLDAFIEYFNSRSRKINENRYARLRFMIGRHGNCADIKTSWIDRPGLRHYAREAHEAAQGLRQPSHPWKRYHLSYHFIRTKPGAGPSAPGQLTHRQRRIDIRRQVIELRRQLAIPDLGETVAVVDGQPIRQELTSRIRSFDVAGNENDEPIELFAPALRWLREKPLTQADRGDRLAARRSLSIHAGEDFDHIVGGLRHLDETIQFCNLGPSDRIGHALALGLSPHDWAKRQGRSFVPLEAHFDNLVWLWHHATSLSRALSAAGGVLPGLERRIAFYARQLGIANREPEVHHRAWLWRRNCAITLGLWMDNTRIADARYWAPDAATIQSASDPAYRELMDYQYGRRRDRHRRIAVALGRDGAPAEEHDCFSTADLDFVEALQDHLMTIYDSRGIVIEACPSSNVFIGRIADVSEHPCLRWHPPRTDLLANGARFNRFGLRRGPIRLCLNTDDPGVFPTTIATEHRLVMEGARTLFDLSQWESETWIDHLRRIGLALFDQAHTEIRYRSLD